MTDVTLAQKSLRLRGTIANFESAIVAYSGGVDSALVAELTHQILGADASLIVTAVSDSLADYELESAQKLAKTRGWNFRTITTSEMQDQRYLRNDGTRCFFCKSELYTHLERIATSEGFQVIANGANRDDLGDYRPGMKAAKNFEVRSPLLETDIGKDEVRALALEADLPNWDKPAQPCLSSRIPYGTHVTPEVLKMISKAEKHLRELGFKECRVRHYGETARVEIPLEMFPIYNSLSTKTKAETGILEAGYQRVELDPKGLRSGNLNETLQPTP